MTNYSHDDAMRDLEYLRLAPSSFAADRIAAYIESLEEAVKDAQWLAEKEVLRTEALEFENAELRARVERYRAQEEILLTVLLNDGHPIDELNTRLTEIVDKTDAALKGATDATHE